MKSKKQLQAMTTAMGSCSIDFLMIKTSRLREMLLKHATPLKKVRRIE